MPLPRIHILRRRLWRLNGLLAIATVALTWSVASAPDPLSSTSTRDWDAEAAPLGVPRSYMPQPGERLADFWPVFHHFYPPVRKQQVAPAPTGPTKLPLRGFELAQVWFHPDKGYFVMLDSKDPAFDEQYFLTENSADRDARILSIRQGTDRLFVSVARGDEEFEFSMPHRFKYSVVGMTLADAPSTSRPQAGVSGGGGALGRVALKGVPFYERGRVIGVRVTGIRPGSWASQFGLKRGDVVCRIDESDVTGAPRAREQLRDAPTSLQVLRLDRGRSSRINLRGS